MSNTVPVKAWAKRTPANATETLIYDVFKVFGYLLFSVCSLLSHSCQENGAEGHMPFTTLYLRRCRSSFYQAKVTEVTNMTGICRIFHTSKLSIDNPFRMFSHILLSSNSLSCDGRMLFLCMHVLKCGVCHSSLPGVVCSVLWLPCSSCCPSGKKTKRKRLCAKSFNSCTPQHRGSKHKRRRRYRPYQCSSLQMFPKHSRWNSIHSYFCMVPQTLHRLMNASDLCIRSFSHRHVKPSTTFRVRCSSRKVPSLDKHRWHMNHMWACLFCCVERGHKNLPPAGGHKSYWCESLSRNFGLWLIKSKLVQFESY